jgi:hypothetical protein
MSTFKKVKHEKDEEEEGPFSNLTLDKFVDIALSIDDYNDLENFCNSTSKFKYYCTNVTVMQHKQQLFERQALRPVLVNIIVSGLIYGGIEIWERSKLMSKNVAIAGGYGGREPLDALKESAMSILNAGLDPDLDHIDPDKFARNLNEHNIRLRRVNRGDNPLMLASFFKMNYRNPFEGTFAISMPQLPDVTDYDARRKLHNLLLIRTFEQEVGQTEVVEQHNEDGDDQEPQVNNYHSMLSFDDDDIGVKENIPEYKTTTTTLTTKRNLDIIVDFKAQKDMNIISIAEHIADMLIKDYHDETVTTSSQLLLVLRRMFSRDPSYGWLFRSNIAKHLRMVDNDPRFVSRYNKDIKGACTSYITSVATLAEHLKLAMVKHVVPPNETMVKYYRTIRDFYIPEMSHAIRHWLYENHQEEPELLLPF